MYRNTYLLVSVLAVITALVIGVNIGRKTKTLDVIQPQPLPTLKPDVIVPAAKQYRNSFCRVEFAYPDTLTVFENASGSAAFTGSVAGDGILLTCQKDIPRPAITQENIEDIQIGSVAAKLYHTQSDKDGTPIDSLIFRHPGTKLDVFLAGSGEAFRKLISSVSLLP